MLKHGLVWIGCTPAIKSDLASRAGHRAGLLHFLIFMGNELWRTRHGNRQASASGVLRSLSRSPGRSGLPEFRWMAILTPIIPARRRRAIGGRQWGGAVEGLGLSVLEAAKSVFFTSERVYTRSTAIYQRALIEVRISEPTGLRMSPHMSRTSVSCGRGAPMLLIGRAALVSKEQKLQYLLILTHHDDTEETVPLLSDTEREAKVEMIAYVLKNHLNQGVLAELRSTGRPWSRAN